MLVGIGECCPFTTGSQRVAVVRACFFLFLKKKRQPFEIMGLVMSFYGCLCVAEWGDVTGRQLVKVSAPGGVRVEMVVFSFWLGQSQVWVLSVGTRTLPRFCYLARKPDRLLLFFRFYPFCYF